MFVVSLLLSVGEVVRLLLAGVMMPVLLWEHMLGSSRHVFSVLNLKLLLMSFCWFGIKFFHDRFLFSNGSIRSG